MRRRCCFDRDRRKQRAQPHKLLTDLSVRSWWGSSLVRWTDRPSERRLAEGLKSGCVESDRISQVSFRHIIKTKDIFIAFITIKPYHSNNVWRPAPSKDNHPRQRIPKWRKCPSQDGLQHACPKSQGAEPYRSAHFRLAHSSLWSS